MPTLLAREKFAFFKSISLKKISQEKEKIKKRIQPVFNAGIYLAAT